MLFSSRKALFLSSAATAAVLSIHAAQAAETPVPEPATQVAAAQQVTAAQQVAAAQIGGAASVAEEVFVTARRRAENVQNIPIAVSVLDSATLDVTGSLNVLKLTQIQPSLQFYSTNPRNSSATIRGLGAPLGLANDGVEQGVGVYVDQVYNSRIASATFDFLDIDQIEILRGPQGTLYGKNTTAGAINVTTRKPSFTFEANSEVTVGNLGYVQARAGVSGPLIDNTLAVRFAASSTNRRGTIYNVTTSNWVNEQDNLGLRGAVLWVPDPSIEIVLSGDYNVQDPECCAQIYVRTGATQRPLNRQFAGLAAAFNYAPPSTNPFDRKTDLDTPLDAYQEIGGISARAEWDIGPGTLTSIAAWRFWNWGPSNDRDFTGLPITTVSANPSKQNQYSQELRYAGSSDNFDYVGGLFAYTQKQKTDGVQEQGAAASRWTLSPTSANANNPAVLNGLRSENEIVLKTTSLAAYGQLGWKVSDRLTLQPGVRINYDKKDGLYNAVVYDGAGNLVICTPPPTNAVLRDQCATPPQTYHPKFDDWNFSGDFTASYQLTDDVLAYGTYAKSFKTGGINLAGLPLDANNAPILAAQTVRPEDINHYEGGLKTQFADYGITLNLAGFWTEISDFQATVNNGQLGVLRGYLANAEKVRVRGIELDFSAQPTDELSLYVNGALNDAKYVKFVDAPCPPELSGGTTVAAGQTPSAPGTPGGLSPAACDISGQILPGVSKWAFSYGAEYAIPAKFIGLQGQTYVAYDGSYRSKFSSNPSRSAYTDIDGYALSNFRVGYRGENRWEIYGWVRNAFDEQYFEVLALQSGSTGLVIGQPADPRTFGLTFKTAY